MKTRALVCPSCGGTMSPPLGHRVVSCHFCSDPFYVYLADFLPRYRLQAKKDLDALLATIRSRLASPLLPDHFSDRFEVISHHRLFLPFYLLSGLRGGSQYFAQRDPVTGELIREDTRSSLGPFQYVYFGATLEHWNLHDTDLRDIILSRPGEIEAVSMGSLATEGEIIDADIPMERVIGTGVASGGEDLSLLELTISLVYLPVLALTLRFQGQIYTLTVDEIEGRLIRGHLPVRSSRAFHIGLPMAAILGWLCGAFLQPWSMEAGKTTTGFWLSILPMAFFVGSAFLLLQACLLFLRIPRRIRVTPEGFDLVRAGPLPAFPIPGLQRPVNRIEIGRASCRERV